MEFLSLSRKFTRPEKSKVAILSVPYEATTSFIKGCNKGPESIIKASSHVELFDEELKIKPHVVGISSHIVEDFNNNHELNLKKIGNKFLELYKKGKFVLSFGGEHSISTGIVDALSTVEKKLSVIQFDAHADLRNYYQKSNYGHACTMRRIYEKVYSISQVGIRSLSNPEFNFMKKEKLNPIFAWEMESMGSQEIVERIRESTVDNVYITFDVDYFSTEVIKDTGTPEPGGPGWYKTLDILREIFECKKVIGIDIVELVGGNDSFYSAFSAALLARKCIGYKFFVTRS